MARRREKVKRSPAKQRRLEKRAVVREARERAYAHGMSILEPAYIAYFFAIRWGVERLWAQRGQGGFEYDLGVVCMSCGLEQPYERGSTCNRQGLLGLPCDSIDVMTHARYYESLA